MTLLVKKYLFLSIFTVSVIAGIQTAAAATYYVSPNGSASWNNCTNINAPCSPAVAMTNAKAGDIVYFRGGKYELYYDLNIDPSDYWYKGVLNPSNSGLKNDPITFAAYPGETPVMNCHTDAIRTDNCRAFGSAKDYIVFDGFYFEADDGLKLGGLIIAGDDRGDGNIRNVGNVVKNITIDGGSTIINTNDNREALRIEKTSGTVVKNCKIFNVRGGPGVQRDDIAGIKSYHNDHLTVENCEIYNVDTGISMKSDTDDSVFRNNYIHDCAAGIFVAVYLTENSDRGKVYNNVLANCSYRGFGVEEGEMATSDGWEVYNNTIYNTLRGIGMANGKWKVWNNIIDDNTNPLAGTRGTLMSESDHNYFGTSSAYDYLVLLRLYQTDQATYKTLSSWKNSGELIGGGNPATGSLVSNPEFLNSSGKMNQLDDFRLATNSPARGAGRSGSDMGANISIVGYKGNDIVRPVPPTLSAN